MNWQSLTYVFAQRIAISISFQHMAIENKYCNMGAYLKFILILKSSQEIDVKLKALTFILYMYIVFFIALDGKK
jgi:hypothetical protein